MRSTTILAAAMFAAASSAAGAATKPVPHAGAYAFNSCKYADANSVTLRPNGDYRFGIASGTWRKDGDIIVINWAIRKEHLHQARTGKKSGVLRYRLVRLKSGRLALRYAGGGELMYRCKQAA